MANSSGGLFGGLKKLLFKEDFSSLPSEGGAGAQASSAPPPADSGPSFGADNAPSQSNTDSMKAKAYQLLESINQPGVDFLEVWNATEEAGGINPQTVKTTFNALKYADKTLTREKLLSTGDYYCAQLQKAIDSDLQRKADQRQQLDQQKAAERRELSNGIAAIEKEISALQQNLVEKQRQLAALDANYEPKLRGLDEKMQAGRATIDAMIREMQSLIAIAQKEL
jgi:hypothetical protein